MGLIFKTSGTAKLFGLDIENNKEEILEQVGYLPSEISYYDNMKAIELLKYSASFYKSGGEERIEELAKRLNLDLSKKIEDMSLGNKKKVGIIQALLHSPKLIILDEPTSGLDPLMQQTFFEILKEEQLRGATILFSSHVLTEVQKMCDRLAIIKDGKILKVQSIQEINEDSCKSVSMTTDKVISDFILEGASNIQQKENQISFLYSGDYNTLLSGLLQYKLTDISIFEPTLEEIFMNYYDSEEKV